MRISEKQLLGYSFGEVNWDKYSFLLRRVPVRNWYPRLGLRVSICQWQKEWAKWDVEEVEGSRAEGPH